MVRRMLFRAVAVSGWIGVIFGLLFLPSVADQFQQDSINMLIWSGVIDPQLFEEFRKETGINVNVTYFSGSEELIVKLLATKSKGYDLIVPSDHVVPFLIKHKLLKKIDKSKLTFYKDLNPKLLGHFFDPKNEYSIPEDWYILGLGVNKKFFKDGLPPAHWKTIFDLSIAPNHLGVVNDSREYISLAISYLYGKIRPINQKEMEAVKDLLIAQKEKIEAYTDFRGDFLLESGNCPVVLVASNFIWRDLEKNKNLAFLVPQEAVILSIENFVIPAESQKDEQVYKLLNFLYSPEVQKHNFEEFSLCSPRKDADYMFDRKGLEDIRKYIHPDTPDRALLIPTVLTEDQINEIWLGVKGS